MGNITVKPIDKLPQAIGSLTSRVKLLEKKVAITQTATSSTLLGATVTFSPTAPTVPAPNVGDLWYNTSNGNQVSQWNGGAWLPYLFGTGGIANNAITNALLANNSVANGNIQTGAVGNSQLQTYILDAGQAMSQYSGQNMITDAQFINPIINAARLADPATTGTWAPSNATVGTPFIVGHNFTNSGTSVTVTIGTAVPQGCAILAVVLAVSGTFAASDTQSNTYTKQSFQTIPSQDTTVLAVSNCTALTTSDTVTVTTSPAVKYAVVIYAVPLGFGFDTNHGYTGTGGTSINFTTQNETYPGDINLAFVCNINNVLYGPGSGGGGTPSGWSYLGGAAQSSYCIESCWQDAPSSLGQPFVTSFASTPANGYLATSIGIRNSGNSGHINVTAQNPGVVLPLMPTDGTNPAMYVNPGEQYALSMNANVPGSVNCQMGIQMVLNTGGILQVTSTGHGYMQVSGTVTIPAGASSAYVELYAKSASGTVAGCTVINPTLALSSMYGANWSLNNTGISVTGTGGSSATASLTVQADNVPVLSLPTNAASEFPGGGAALWAEAANPGASNEYLELVLAGPTSNFDGQVAEVSLTSSAANGSVLVAGALCIDLVNMLYWDSQGVHVVSNLYGSSGTVRIQDNVLIGTTGSPKTVTLHGQLVTDQDPVITGITLFMNQTISGSWPTTGTAMSSGGVASANNIAAALNDLYLGCQAAGILH